MNGKVLKKIATQRYLVRLEDGNEVEAFIGLKPLVLTFGGQFDINQLIRVKLTSENKAIISPRDPTGS
ncbi:hypothetical protein [Microscilla marina]|uniref:Uncharacterized protein n=1 Tax=Microscilla marina ATCC 23134 TaxID=313606 RepID=A1ZPT2_MICM2|nr:hypothetical protein [Microscilla marina]EAY27587.1 hypothetical protein M23134_02834 [Microscilla marina ATCC 23134]